MTSYDLSGRHALVTGGAQGLGEGMAGALAAAGASVVVGDVQESGADIARSLGAGHGFVRLDVTDEASWEAAVASTLAQIGGFDILVNNAGIEITSLITEVEPADVRRMLDVNVLGTALGLKHALRAMRPGDAPGRRGRPGWRGGQHRVGGGDDRVPGHLGVLGHQVRCRPVDPRRGGGERQARLQRAGQLRLPGPGAYGHGGGSGERRRRTRAVRLARGRGGRRCRAHPGRLGTVEDMADAVVFLASDASRFITGVGLSVDGGMGV